LRRYFESISILPAMGTPATPKRLRRLNQSGRRGEAPLPLANGSQPIFSRGGSRVCYVVDQSNHPMEDL